MAAPPVVARVTPIDPKLTNGYQALIAFQLDPDFSLWEKEVTPPGIEGGDPIDTMTQHDVEYATQAPRALIKHEGGQFTAGYNPGMLVNGDSMINQPQAITYHFPNTDSITYWGYLRSIKATGMSDGTMPLCTAMIEITNYDPYNCVQAGPVYTPGNGSC